MQDEKPRRWNPKPIAQSAKPTPTKPPPPPPNPHEMARRALDVFLDSSGDLHLSELAEAVRKIPKEDLAIFQASIPIGYGRTAVKCQRAREVVSGVMQEKA